MSCVPCTVVHDAMGWMVQCESAYRGPYQSHEIALRVALADALTRRRSGQRARVSAKNHNGDVCAEYCLCANFKVQQN